MENLWKVQRGQQGDRFGTGTEPPLGIIDRLSQKEMCRVGSAGRVNRKSSLIGIGLGGFDMRRRVSGVAHIDTRSAHKHPYLQSKNRNPSQRTHAAEPKPKIR